MIALTSFSMIRASSRVTSARMSGGTSSSPSFTPAFASFANAYASWSFACMRSRTAARISAFRSGLASSRERMYDFTSSFTKSRTASTNRSSAWAAPTVSRRTFSTMFSSAITAPSLAVLLSFWLLRDAGFIHAPPICAPDGRVRCRPLQGQGQALLRLRPRPAPPSGPPDPPPAVPVPPPAGCGVAEHRVPPRIRGHGEDPRSAPLRGRVREGRGGGGEGRRVRGRQLPAADGRRRDPLGHPPEVRRAIPGPWVLEPGERRYVARPARAPPRASPPGPGRDRRAPEEVGSAACVHVYPMGRGGRSEHGVPRPDLVESGRAGETRPRIPEYVPPGERDRVPEVRPGRAARHRPVSRGPRLPPGHRPGRGPRSDCGPGGGGGRRARAGRREALRGRPRREDHHHLRHGDSREGLGDPDRGVVAITRGAD